MENRESPFHFSPIRDMLLSDNWIPEDKRPDKDAWVKVQGGRPEIKFDENGKTFNVKHNYINKKDPSGTGVVVPTSFREVEDWGKIRKVTKVIDGREIYFPVVLLWEKHGKPCEASSLSVGGERYKRVKVNSL